MSRRKPREAIEWRVLLPLEWSYARDVLKGIGTYLQTRPPVVLRIGDNAGLPTTLSEDRVPVIWYVRRGNRGRTGAAAAAADGMRVGGESPARPLPPLPVHPM